MIAPNGPSPLWNVPYQRNPFFTGREDVLHSLHEALQSDSIVGLSHPQGIRGLGGIGKTQTALEYAYRYRAEYQAILWVRADSAATLTASFVELAHVLELPEGREQDQEGIVQAVLRWFRLHRGWLLIYDNIEDLSTVEPFLPKAGPGHVVLTTRAHTLSGTAQSLEMQKMEPDIGALLLLRRASILPLQATLDLASEDDLHCARLIAQELDGLPIALDQAGAYIKEMACTLSDYLLLYQQRRRDLLQTRGTVDMGYPASVATTWSLSLEKIAQANPASSELLTFYAFLAPNAIPEEILTVCSPYLGDPLASIAAYPIQLDLAIREPLRFSLIARDADTQSITMHRLVQAVLQDTLPAETRTLWEHRVVNAINAAFPDATFENWARCEQLSSHALVCAHWIEQEHITGPEAARLLYEAGSYLYARARYPEAGSLLKQALAIREQQAKSGAVDLDTALLLNSLASLYQAQGWYAEAEPLFRRALSICEKRLGPQHPNTHGLRNELSSSQKTLAVGSN
jgi:tetratricopeptide (TPR) repeat protein